VDRNVHYFGERVHNRKVVLLGKGMEMINMDVVVHESNLVGMGVVLCMVRLAHSVDDGSGHMEVNGEKGACEHGGSKLC